MSIIREGSQGCAHGPNVFTTIEIQCVHYFQKDTNVFGKKFAVYHRGTNFPGDKFSTAFTVSDDTALGLSTSLVGSIFKLKQHYCSKISCSDKLNLP